MERGIITSHGMAAIITRGQSHGGMEYIIIHILVGVSHLELVMVGSVGVSILTEGDIGDLVDITEGIDMDTIAATGMALEVGIGQGIELANAIQTEMYITTVAQELNKAVTSEMPRLQIILTIKDKLQAKQITCTPIRTGMFTSEIRMATTKTNQTGRVNNPVSSLLPINSKIKLNRDRHKTGSNNHLPVSSNNSDPNRARYKVISGNNWTSPIKTGARELKTITGHNSINEVEAGADQVEEEAGVAAEAGEGNFTQP